MKRNKKLSRGMTLVEVIVAMTIFAAMAAAIFSVIAHANKTADRAKMRDVELSAQTNIIGKRNKGLDELNQVTPNGYDKDYQLIFTRPGKTDTLNGYKVYETNEGEFDEYFDFKLKNIVQTSSLTGLTLHSDELEDNEYLLRFENNTSEPVTIRMNLADGHIFEGVKQQYVHTMKYYCKTIPANSVADIGFYNDKGTVTNGLWVQLEGVVSHSFRQYQFNSGSFRTGIRTARTVISQNGSDPAIIPAVSYPTTPV